MTFDNLHQVARRLGDHGRHQAGSQYANHPRITWFGSITWFGIGGPVAYVDYISATESYFIGGDGNGGFTVIPPSAGEDEEVGGFDSIDAAIEYALAASDKEGAR